MKKYVVFFYNNYTLAKEVFGEYDTEEEVWDAVETAPELDFLVYKMV